MLKKLCTDSFAAQQNTDNAKELDLIVNASTTVEKYLRLMADGQDNTFCRLQRLLI